MYQTAHSIYLRHFLFIIQTASEEIAFQNQTTSTNEVKHRFQPARRTGDRCGLNTRSFAKQSIFYQVINRSHPKLSIPEKMAEYKTDIINIQMNSLCFLRETL